MAVVKKNDSVQSLSHLREKFSAHRQKTWRWVCDRTHCVHGKGCICCAVCTFQNHSCGGA